MPKVERAWELSPAQLYKEFESSERGLSEHEVKRRSLISKNELPEKDRKAALSILISQFENPLVYLLIFATILAYFLGDVIEGTVILLIITLNSILGFFLEYKAEKALRELKKYITFTSNVMRDGEKKEVDAQSLVVGDVVFLRIGNIVPADVRLLSCEEFETNESVLTGESALVEKNTSQLEVNKAEPQLLRNMAFMGTTVASGHAVGIVTAVGMDTFFGKTAMTLSARVPQSHFERSIREFGNMLLRITLIMTLFVFVINAIFGKNPLDSFLFAVALAVGITPEALPIVITIALSNGALELARKKVVVKKLISLEDLGNVDVFCADKTGTLSETEVSLEKAVGIEGEPSQVLLEYAVLCNTQFGTKRARHTGQIDSAILKFANQRIDKKRIVELEKTKVVDTVDFDYDRKRMSVLIEKNRRVLMITKGAAESVVAVCSKVMKDDKETRLTPSLRSKYEEYAGMGYSVVALAVKEVGRKNNFTKEDEVGLSLMGFLLFTAPPRKTAAHTVSELRKLGVEMKVLTGDGPIVTKKLCSDVGFSINENRVVTGDELDGMGDEELQKLAERYNVFARITPTHKYRIVLALRDAGHVVAFLGDGVNDAPALRAADVGISVNNAVDVAKDAAHIILLSSSLEAVLTGIRGGRKIFGNITKYVLNTISANFGNMFSVASTSLFLPFLPMLPSQILLNNLLSDMPMLTVSTDNVDSTFLRKPKRWNMKLISDFMVRFGLISFVFDMIMMGSMLYLLHATENSFRTGWFLLSLISELVITYSIRTQMKFYKSRPSTLMIAGSILAFILSIIVVYSPIGVPFQFTHVGVEYLALTAGVVLLYFAVVEVTKLDFFEKYGL
ncbi:MAG: Mg(2+) transport ATPase, P-type [Candidatus Fermentimicrarchaeum limneticum]|uniref:Magnesium-transporting ATPase, P-type 1 n=1 Tax=Fermentimicrarchaeum limneticum TaxID=2795018 RepID=A0A7D6BSQ4_FERL1|nr:MAG: Mg(2+) transport ATPase, P-type [Candidatus Fermentimicrarchaeum limneticum]